MNKNPHREETRLELHDKSGALLMIDKKERRLIRELLTITLKSPNTRQWIVKKLGKELGVDEVRFKTAQIYDYRNGNPLIPLNEKYSRYERRKDGKYRLKNKLKNQCWKMWHSCVVTWDGTVVPCCFDKDSAFPMGNVRENNFKQIWRSNCYKELRQKLSLIR